MLSPKPRSGILNWEEKVKLQGIVDDLQFATDENKQEYKCAGCDRIALCHYLTECNHLYCGHCHGKINEKQCLVEGCQQVVSKIKQNKQLEEKIANLKVFCPFRKNGCLEEVSLKNYLEHESTCALSSRNILPKLYRKDQTAELQIETQEMKKTITDLRNKNRLLEHQLLEFKSHQGLLLTEIQNEQKNFKQMVALQMEKSSLKNKSMRAELKNNIKDLQSTNKLLNEEHLSFKNHLNSLQSKIQADYKHFEEVIPVYMEKFALDNEGKISKMQEHTDAMMLKCDENLKVTCEEVTTELQNHVKDVLVGQGQTEEMHILIKDLDLKLDCLAETDNDSKCTEYSLEVKEIGQLISGWLSGSNAIYSNTFALRGVGLQNKIELASCGKDVCITSFFQQLHNFVPQQPLFFKQSICILDQSETGTRRHNSRKNFPSFKDKADQEGRYLLGRKTNFFIPIKLFEEKIYPYVKEDRVTIQFLIEPISFSYNAYFSKSGKLLWRIDKYKERRQNGIEGVNTVLYSDYFYSNETGYRMVLEARFHHSSTIFGLRFVKGKYDDFLPTHFPHKTTLHIHDQSQPCGGNHLTRTCDSEEARFDKFVEMNHEDIEKDNFLKDECILLEVIVEPRKPSH